MSRTVVTITVAFTVTGIVVGCCEFRLWTLFCVTPVKISVLCVMSVFECQSQNQRSLADADIMCLFARIFITPHKYPIRSITQIHTNRLILYRPIQEESRDVSQKPHDAF